MGWPQVVSAELGAIIITAPDCLHCIELQAHLSERPLEIPCHWIEQKNAGDLFQRFPLFAQSIDVLPFAGIFSNGKVKAVIRAASRERIEEGLSEP